MRPSAESAGGPTRRAHPGAHRLQRRAEQVGVFAYLPVKGFALKPGRFRSDPTASVA